MNEWIVLIKTTTTKMQTYSWEALKFSSFDLLHKFWSVYFFKNFKICWSILPSHDYCLIDWEKSTQRLDILMLNSKY